MIGGLVHLKLVDNVDVVPFTDLNMSDACRSFSYLHA